ncbi:mucin-5AC-like [Ananas comosus]|uniref:Mucin-5AC-like n=1 Tax=Ananas comosus TaxID=4615 RepID=A0A6P5HH89_ANACO|nr:mucin-5AC-like [Ananas comosus]
MLSPPCSTEARPHPTLSTPSPYYFPPPFSSLLAPAPAPAPPPPPTNPNPSRPFLSSSHGPAAPASAAAASGASAPAGPGQQRSSRKRTRASRRAPTTVLTTDTTNFRAMVQEFTGIPSPPFAAAAAAATTLQYRSSARFGGHLFSGGGASSSSAAAAADPAAQPQQPPYLLRPFAQKLQPFLPLPSPSCPTSANTAATTTATASTSTAINTSPITATLTTCSSSSGSSNLTTPTNTNYQLPSPQHSLLNTQHPILSFQSLLQSQPPSNYAMPNMLTFSTRPPHFTVSSTQYGSGDVGLPPGLIGSEDLSGWAGGNAASQSRPAGPNYAAGSAPQQRGSSCKVNYSSAAGSSAPDQFNAEKGSENAAAGSAAAAAAATTTTTTTTIGEGTVDSWICSSRRDH